VTIGDDRWWRRAIVYQIYIRSFADADGDGIGDIAGIRSRLPYLQRLGVDAIWITPWYRSPMADGGYDVADYRDIDPLFGSLADADELIATAHEHGIRVLIDIVPNHTSERHPWFQAALTSPPGSPERARYLFRDGRGPGGVEPPNDWRSVFGGGAWTRVVDADGVPGQWYVHLFAPEQPDLDWSNQEVRDEFESIVRFWLDRGVDGFRIDVANSLAKDPVMPDIGPVVAGAPPPAPGNHPHWDRDEVHEVYRSWRAIADGYTPRRVFVGEIHVSRPERRARYLRSDELHTAFNFDFLLAPWTAGLLRSAIDSTIDALGQVGAPATWVLSNHDYARHVTRFGRSQTVPGDLAPSGSLPGDPEAVDLALGTRRARAAALLMLALPGGAYVYQGEELGLWEVEDLPDALLQDPIWTRSGHEVRGRDGCRVPIPWSGDAPPFGFGPDGSVPWLPQPAAWAGQTAAAEEGDPASMLTLYREAIRVRRDHPGFATEAFRWVAGDPTVLHFERGEGLACLVNLSTAPVPLPAGAEIVLSSLPIPDGSVPVDVTVWYSMRGAGPGSR
jgi:alpha-glucosidase